jgi:hypothetical protein
MDNKENKTPIQQEGDSLLQASDTAYIGLMTRNLQVVSKVSPKK